MIRILKRFRSAKVGIFNDNCVLNRANKSNKSDMDCGKGTQGHRGQKEQKFFIEEDFVREGYTRTEGQK